MANWEYKVTSHIIEELKKCEEQSEKRAVFSCNESGSCMVNDVCTMGTSALESVLNENGKEGWELIETNYHHGELLCIWKKPR